MSQRPIDIIFSFHKKSSFPVAIEPSVLELPDSLACMIHPIALDINDLRMYSQVRTQMLDLLFSEILFVYFPQQKRWRFMGASINYFDGDSIEELGSSIFRSDPTLEIEAPWSCLYTFCETALCSSYGRIVPPFIRLAAFSQDETASIWLPLLLFRYETMEWVEEIVPFSRPA